MALTSQLLTGYPTMWIKLYPQAWSLKTNQLVPIKSSSTKLLWICLLVQKKQNKTKDCKNYAPTLHVQVDNRHSHTQTQSKLRKNNGHMKPPKWWEEEQKRNSSWAEANHISGQRFSEGGKSIQRNQPMSFTRQFSMGYFQWPSQSPDISPTENGFNL